jgi:hypothetical protein
MASGSAFGGMPGWVEKSALQLAPDLMKLVAPSLRRISVQEAPLHNDNWIRSIRGTPSVVALAQFLELAGIITTVQLEEGTADSVKWCLTPNSCYSARSAYHAFFFGRIKFSGVKELWSGRPAPR